MKKALTLFLGLAILFTFSVNSYAKDYPSPYNPNPIVFYLSKYLKPDFRIQKIRVQDWGRLDTIHNRWFVTVYVKNYGGNNFNYQYGMLVQMRAEYDPSVRFGTGTVGDLPYHEQSGWDHVYLNAPRSGQRVSYSFILDCVDNLINGGGAQIPFRFTLSADQSSWSDVCDEGNYDEISECNNREELLLRVVTPQYIYGTETWEVNYNN